MVDIDINKRIHYIRCPNCKDIPEVYFEGDNHQSKCAIKCLCVYEDFKIIDIKTFIDDITANAATKKVIPQCLQHMQQKHKYCLDCSIWLCPTCLLEHSSEHVQIDQEIKAVCSHHHQKFISYCQICKLNLCSECKEQDPSHEIYAHILLQPIDLSCFDKKEQLPNGVSSQKTQDCSIKVNDKLSVQRRKDLLKRLNPNPMGIYTSNSGRLESFLLYAYDTIKALQNYPSYQLKKLCQTIQLDSILSNSSLITDKYEQLQENFKTNWFLSNRFYIENKIKKQENHLKSIAKIVKDRPARNPKINLLIKKLIPLSNEQLVTMSSNVIKLWNIKTFECLTSFIFENSDSLDFIQLFDGRFVFCLDISSILIFDLNPSKCFKIITEHTKPIFKFLQLKNRNLVSGSKDNSIKIWDINSYQCLFSLNIHYHSRIELILFNNDCLCSNQIYNISVWDSTSFKLLQRLEETKTVKENLIELDNNQLASSHSSKVIEIWDLQSYKFLGTITKENISFSTLIKVYDNQLASSEKETLEINIWNTQSLDWITTIKLTEKIDSCFLSINEYLLITSRNTIQIWNIQSMHFVITLYQENKIKTIIQLSNEDLVYSSYDEYGVWIKSEYN